MSYIDRFPTSEEIDPWGTPEAIQFFDEISQLHKNTGISTFWKTTMHVINTDPELDPELKKFRMDEFLDHKDDPLAVVIGDQVIDSIENCEVVGFEYGLATVNPRLGVANEATYMWTHTLVEDKVIEASRGLSPLQLETLVAQQKSQEKNGLTLEL